jgi:methanogenic corrinoid protein MtbC1
MNSPELSTPMTFSIAAVERDTGIGKDTLRVWERRYGFPMPGRDAHDERSYPLAQVEKLRVIKRLMDQGHRPGRIVAQPLEVLHQLGRGEAQPHATNETPASQMPAHLQVYLSLLQAQDVDGLRLAWHQALSKVGLQRFVTEVAAPMTYWVGEAWAQGDLAVHQEHLFTECLSVVMRQAMAAIPQVAPSGAPKVLLTTFPQEAHGLGLLMVESLLTLQGCRCVSLGTQTPVRDIAQAAAAHQVDVVALSFSANMKPNHVVDGLAELQALLPPRVAVWAGGSASALRRRPLDRVCVLHDLDAISGAVTQHLRQQKQAHAQTVPSLAS